MDIRSERIMNVVQEIDNVMLEQVKAEEAEQGRFVISDDCKANGLPTSGATFTAKEKSLGLDYSSRQRHINAHFPALAVELRAYGKDWEERLEIVLEREKNTKRHGLIKRVKEIVGEVTDATGLYEADDGEINGVVIGAQGKARVTTISAGGYNVQCFHFRVLVKAI